MSKSGTIQAVVAAIFGITIVVWLHFSVFDKSETADSSMDSMFEHKNTSGGSGTSSTLLQQTIKIINSTCPKQLDEQTRLDSAGYLPGNVFAEYFTLITIERSAIDTATSKPTVEASILSNLKANAGYATFKSANVTFAFIYKDKAQAPVFTINITPEQYNN
jgi:hypothetical protein